MTTATVEYKSLDHPDDVMKMERGQVNVVATAHGNVARLRLEPGWEWSKHEKPLFNTEWCEIPHFLYLTQGRLHIKMQNGDEFDLAAGDVCALPSGHDGWVIGAEAVVGIDFSGCTEFGKA